MAKLPLLRVSHLQEFPHIPTRPQDAPVRQHKEEPAAEEAQLSPWWQWVLPPHCSDLPPDGKQHVLSQTRVTGCSNKWQHQDWQRGRENAWGNSPDWMQLVGCRRENKMLQVQEGIWNHSYFPQRWASACSPSCQERCTAFTVIAPEMSKSPLPLPPLTFPWEHKHATQGDRPKAQLPHVPSAMDILISWGCAHSASQLFIRFSPNFWHLAPQKRSYTSIHLVPHGFLWLFWLTLKGTAGVERDLNFSHQERAVLASLSQPRDTCAKER